MDHFSYLCFVSCFLVRCSLVVTCWERADLLTLFCVMFYCVFVTFPCCVLGQVWCLIVLYRYLIFAFILTFMMKSHLLNNSLCRYPLLRSNSNVNQQHMLLGKRENFNDVYTCFVPGPLHMPQNQDACFCTTKMFIFTRQLIHPICSLLT